MPSRLVVVAVVVAAVVISTASLVAQRPVERMSAHVFTSPEHGSLSYRLFEPEPADAGRRLPLVLFLHGAGERGDDNSAQLQHGVATFVADDQQAKRPCLVVAPQCPRGRWWDVDLLLDFAVALAARPDVDPDRFYVTGLSMGGYATWYLAGRRPDLFAAAVPVCGGGEVDAAPRLTGLPIWAFHGAADRTVSVDRSREMVAALRKAGGAPKYTEYPDVGHDSWTQTYADDAVHEWMFAQRRVPRVTLADGDRVVFFGDSITEAGAGEKGFIGLIGSALRVRMPDARVELIGAGVSGNRVPDLQARVERDVLARKPTIVIVYIGINDVWHSLRGHGTPIADYESGLRSLLDAFAGIGARVVLCTPSVIGEKADGSNRLDGMLDEYAAASRKVAAAAGVAVLDLRRRFLTSLRKSNADNAERGVLTADGVHLNDAGNRFVADAMLEALGVQPAPSRPEDGAPGTDPQAKSATDKAATEKAAPKKVEVKK